MKKLLSLILAAVLMLSLIPAASAADDAPSFIKVNGARATFTIKPFIDNGSTFVPVRFISEQLGFSVDWTESTQTVSIDGGRIVFNIGASTATVDGATVTMSPTSRKLNGDTTFVPLRFISENLDCTVDWFAENNSIIINRKNADGTEVSAFTRCEQSELYTRRTGTQAQILDPKDGSDYHIEMYFNGERNQSQIIIDKATYQTRRVVHDVLKTWYPTGYEQVYELMKQTALGQIFRDDGASDIRCGTQGSFVYDVREVNMSRSTAGGKFTIIIRLNDVGYVTEAGQPMEYLDQESIDRYMEYYRMDDGALGEELYYIPYQLDKW